MKQRRNQRVFYLAMVLLVLTLLLSLLVSITLGNADITIKQVYSVLGYKILHLKQFSSFGSGAIHDVVWLIRFPRCVLALAVGMALSVSGVVIQAIAKNPLAEPYVLGISSGATLGATLSLILGIGSMLGSNFVGIMAFLGAMATSFFVLFLSNIGGKANTGKLILSGMAATAICSALSNFILYLADNDNVVAEVAFWNMGSLASANWNSIKVILPVILICTMVFCTQFRNLNLMLMGDEVSVTLGTDLYKIRLVYLILSSVMVGFAVYSAGSIAFVGLIIPHVVRMLFGTDHKRVIPLSALLGAVFLIWADAACRMILKNAEMPIGILVSLIGAPCFIYLLIKKSYGFGGRDK